MATPPRGEAMPSRLLGALRLALLPGGGRPKKGGVWIFKFTFDKIVGLRGLGH